MYPNKFGVVAAAALACVLSAHAQPTSAPRPAIVVEQARETAPKTVIGEAQKANSPGLRKYSGEDARLQADTMAAAEFRSIQDRATVLTEFPKSLSLYVGQMTLIKTAEVARVAIGNGKVLSAKVLDGDTILVTALDAGDSTLHVWAKNGLLKKIKTRVNIADHERTIDELKEMTSGIPGVTIKRVGERVVMDGTNLDPGAVTRLDTLAKIYPHVLNLSTADRIRVDRMVDIQVQIIEFSKSALDDLGVKWQSQTDGFSFGLFSDITSASNFRILPEGSAFNPNTEESKPFLSRNQRGLNGYLGLATTLSSRINLLVQRGNAFVLAAPNLTTRSGGEAKFLAGGEIPLPSVGAFGAGNVDFKAYGVLLNIKPIADGEGNIAGNIFTEVSNIDRSVVVQGIPGLLIRRTDTEFNVKDGETVVLSGLISREASRSSDGLPGLRRLPILGRAFRSDNDTDRESEVVVFITPRIVDSSYGKPRIERATSKQQDMSQAFGELNREMEIRHQTELRNGSASPSYNGRMNPEDGP